MPIFDNLVITPVDKKNVRYGVILQLHPGDREFETEIEVAEGKSTDATAAATSTTTRLAVKQPGVTMHTDLLPNDGATRHYRSRHILPGYCAGTFTDYLCAIPIILDVGEKKTKDRGGGQGDDEGGGIFFLSEARRRGDTFYGGDQLFRNVVSIADTAGSFGINRHNESNQEENTEDVTFAANFAAIPRVSFIPQNAKVYSSGLGAGGGEQTQFMSMEAQDPTISGFTLSAIIRTTGSSTQTTDGWSTAQNTVAPENSGASIQDDGAVLYCNLEDTTSAVITYNAFFDVNTLSMNAANLLTVQFSYNSGATSTTFVLGAGRNYNSGILVTDEQLSFAAGLGSSFDLRLKVSYTSDPGLLKATVTGLGEDDAQPGVVYNVAGSFSFESMTPSTGTSVLWQATEAP